MAQKKIEIVVDVKSEKVDIVSDKVLTLTEQVKILKKEIQKAGPGPEQDLLIAKYNDINDELDKTNLKSKEFLGAISSLPGPVGDFAGTMDFAVNSLRNFTSFSFKDIKTQLGGLGSDFTKIATNIGNLTGISKLYAFTNVLVSNSLKAVGIASSTSSKGVQLFSKALIATGIGAIVIAIGLLIANFDKVKKVVLNLIPGLSAVGDVFGKLIDTFTDFIGLTNESERAEAKRQATFAKAKANTDIVNQGIQREINLLKAKGATQEEIDKKEKLLIENQLKDLRLAANERGVLYGEQATLYKDLINKLAVIDETAKTTQREKDKKNADEKTANNVKENEKKQLENKKHNEKIAADNKTADDTAISVQKEIDVLSITDERKRQDKELENQKIAEQDKIKALEIDAVKKATIIKQIDDKYKLKQKDVDDKRIIEDTKKNADLTYKQIEFERESRLTGIQTKLMDIDNANKSEIEKIQARRKLLDEQAQIDRDKEVENLKKLLDAKELTQKEYDDRKALLDEKQRVTITANAIKTEKDLVTQRKANLDAVQQLAIGIGALGEAMGEESAAGRALIKVSQALALATTALALADSLAGLGKALKLPFPGNVVAVTSTLALMATAFSQFKALSSGFKTDASGPSGGQTSAPTMQNTAGYGDGGMINGPLHAAGGVMINAEGGEAVMTRGAVTMFAPLLSQLNQAGGGTSFSKGATGQANYDAPQQQAQTQILRTYVVENELTSIQHKQARLKDLSTL
jgi:hypothetical protein